MSTELGKQQPRRKIEVGFNDAIIEISDSYGVWRNSRDLARTMVKTLQSLTDKVGADLQKHYVFFRDGGKIIIEFDDLVGSVVDLEVYIAEQMTLLQAKMDKLLKENHIDTGALTVINMALRGRKEKKQGVVQRKEQYHRPVLTTPKKPGLVLISRPRGENGI